MSEITTLRADRRRGPGRSPDSRSGITALAAAVAVGVLVSCARQGSPPGGPPDNLRPEVVSTRPDTFADIEDLDGPIRVQFSERISEQPLGGGRLDNAVLVSPREGPIRVRHRRDAIEVEMGGVRPGVVYRVTVLPVIQDLFGNSMEAPFEFVFSTGGEYHPNAVAGMVLDRITGEALGGADVVASPDWTDTLDLVYVSRTDTSGIFALRYVPPGRYRLEAFQDRDLDQAPDPFEVQGESSVLLGQADTILNADVVVLMPDTLPARLARVSLEDSTRVRLTFDDYLDPEAPLGGVSVVLEPRPDTTPEGVRMPPPAPAIESVIHEHRYTAWRDSVLAERALEDSLVAAAAADSAAAVGDSAALATADSLIAALSARSRAGAARVPGGNGNIPRAPGQGPRVLLDGRPLPGQSLVAVLASPLAAGSEYFVRVGGVVNVNGLGGGAGEGIVRRPAPPPPDSADSAAPDTLGVTPGADSLAPDTAAPLPPPPPGDP